MLRSWSQEFWKGRSWSRIFYLRPRNPDQHPATLISTPQPWSAPRNPDQHPATLISTPQPWSAPRNPDQHPATLISTPQPWSAHKSNSINYKKQFRVEHWDRSVDVFSSYGVLLQFWRQSLHRNVLRTNISSDNVLGGKILQQVRKIFFEC